MFDATPTNVPSHGVGGFLAGLPVRNGVALALAVRTEEPDQPEGDDSGEDPVEPQGTGRAEEREPEKGEGQETGRAHPVRTRSRYKEAATQLLSQIVRGGPWILGPPRTSTQLWRWLPMVSLIELTRGSAAGSGDIWWGLLEERAAEDVSIALARSKGVPRRASECDLRVPRDLLQPPATAILSRAAHTNIAWTRWIQA